MDGVRLLALVACLAAPMGCDAQEKGEVWTVAPDFAGEDARYELSGAACTPRWCLAVNDETRWAQAFTLTEGTLAPGAVLRLLPEGSEEIDAEAVAAGGGFVYVTGSHGLSRKKARFRASQFLVFRFPPDPGDGGIERSDRLRDAIRRAPGLAAFAERPLDANGANIEGMAVDGHRLFFGFRGPSVDGAAFVLEVDARALFGDAPLTSIVHEIPLGDRTGIRDMARVRSGFLLLTGPVNEQTRRQGVVLWRPNAEGLTPLLTFDPPDGGKAEGLLVLSESAGSIRVLMLHDGLKNGGPVAHILPLP